MLKSARRAAFLALCHVGMFAGIVHGQPVDNAGFITSSQWLVLGPFKQFVKCGANDAELLRNFIAPAAIPCEYPEAAQAIDYDEFLAASAEYLGPRDENEQPFWRAFSDGADDAFQNLAAEPGNTCDRTQDKLCFSVLSWLATYVEWTGDEAVDVELCIGNDDGGQVWLDEELVYNRSGCKPAKACRDRVAVTISPGVHRIAIGVFDFGDDWGASLGLLRDGEPIVSDTPNWVFHGTSRPEFTPPECPPLVSPVEELSCAIRPDAVALSWLNPPTAAREQEIVIRVGEQVAETLPGDRMEVDLPLALFPEVGSTRVCVTNESGFDACCDVELLGPVTIDRCRFDAEGGLVLEWENPSGARAEQTIRVQIDGSEVARVAGDRTGVVVSGAELPPGFDEVCVVNASGEGACCRPRATDPEGRLRAGNWLVLGPFLQRIECSGRELDHVLLENYIFPTLIDCQYPRDGDEIDYVMFDAASDGYEGPLGETFRPRWRLFDDGSPDDGDNDLLAAVGSGASTDGLMAWVATYFEYRGQTPIDAEVCLGVGDAGQLWLDDRRIFNKYECGFREDCEHRVAVRITPGVHRLTLGVFNGTEAWGFRVAFHVGGEPVTDDAQLWPDWGFFGTVRPEGELPCRDEPTDVPFLRGNVNADDRTDLSDAVTALNFLFLGGDTPSCVKTADTDDSGELNVSDAVFLLNYLFLGGPALPEPFSICAVDETPDLLDCEAFEPCR